MHLRKLLELGNKIRHAHSRAAFAASDKPRVAAAVFAVAEFVCSHDPGGPGQHTLADLLGTQAGAITGNTRAHGDEHGDGHGDEHGDEHGDGSDGGTGDDDGSSEGDDAMPGVLLHLADEDTDWPRSLEGEWQAVACCKVAASPSVAAGSPAACDCGLPWLVDRSGAHQCRYYGTFECGLCGQTWASAHTWLGETQGCDACKAAGTPTMVAPSSMAKLRYGAHHKSGRHHDTEQCSKCERLGYDCSRRR